MFDSHTHLNHPDFTDDLAGVVHRSAERLKGLINIGYDLASSQAAITLAQEHQWMYATIGYSPSDYLEYIQQGGTPQQMQEDLLNLIPLSGRIVAIGEIGLDYHYPSIAAPRQKKQQIEGFRTQIEFAIQQQLPVVVHSREAFPETIQILSEFAGQGLSGVWHSFAEGIEQALRILAIGWYIGLNGIVTFPSAQALKETVAEIPLAKILLETDAPYLAPQAYRGQRNEPWMVGEVAQEIAEIKETTVADVELQTDRNAQDLFRIRWDG